MTRKARTEGASFADKYPEAKAKGGEFAAFVERFKVEHPDKWEELKLCPLQHGVEEMAALLG